MTDEMDDLRRAVEPVMEAVNVHVDAWWCRHGTRVNMQGDGCDKCKPSCVCGHGQNSHYIYRELEKRCTASGCSCRGYEGEGEQR